MRRDVRRDEVFYHFSFKMGVIGHLGAELAFTNTEAFLFMEINPPFSPSYYRYVDLHEGLSSPSCLALLAWVWRFADVRSRCPISLHLP